MESQVVSDQRIDPIDLLAAAESDAAEAATPWLRARSFANIARHAADMGEHEHLHRCLAQSEHELGKLRLRDRIWIMRTLVRATTKAGWRDATDRLADQAADFARRIRSPLCDRGIALDCATDIAVAAGKLDLALTLIGLDRSGDADLHRSNVVERMSRRGLVDQALSVAETIGDPGWRSQAVRQVAIAFALRGEESKCADALQRVQEHGWRAMAMAEVAEALFRHGPG